MKQGSPSQLYQALLADLHIQENKQQVAVLRHIDAIYHAFTVLPHEKKRSFLPAWLDFFPTSRNTANTLGIYLYGQVGRGKTMLMDLLCQSLANEQYRRLHYLECMQAVHSHLQQVQGLKTPMPTVAKALMGSARLLCLDEMMVTDITDAMLIGDLLRALVADGCTLFFTSNQKPNALYHNGLQRARFLPAIELIEQHCVLLDLDHHSDYRLAQGAQVSRYHIIEPSAQQAALQQSMSQTYLGAHVGAQQHLMLHGHRLDILAANEFALMLSFAELCQKPRHPRDYLWIAQHYRRLVVLEVPQLSDREPESVRRFIALIDALYQEKVQLVITAKVDLMALYQDSRFEALFSRCQSRLIEMQSHSYWHASTVNAVKKKA